MRTAVLDITTDPHWGDNKVLHGDLSIHDWYRFVLAFPPHLVRSYLQRFGSEPGQTLLDPFCGTGTSLVEGKAHGLEVIGLDVNPIACLAARVKTSWNRIDTEELRRALSRVVRRAEGQCRKLHLVDADLPLFNKSDGSPPSDNLPCLSEEEEKLLLKDSVSPLPMAKLIILRDAIQQVDAPLTKECLLLALARCAVADASNIGFGPEVYVQKKRKLDAPVISLYSHRVQQMVKDIDEVGDGGSDLQPVMGGDATVIQADSRQMSEKLRGREIHAIITSPPYPNEKDYTRAVRLELVLLGHLRNRKELRALKESFLRSNSRGVYVGDEDDKYLNGNQRVEALAQEIETRRLELGKTSGFERMYHKVVRQFFGGMAHHLKSLKQFLAPGANLAYVVGDQASFFLIHIHTAEILAEIAEDQGYEVQGIELWRERRATASKALLREDVLVLRWKG